MKTDARVRYTKMRIREAFFQLLREKNVRRITVKELCDLAEINRATFYAHYSDPFDLLEKLEAEALEQMSGWIKASVLGGESGVLLTMLKSVQEGQSETSLLASPNGDPGFSAKISAIFSEAYLPRLADRLPASTVQQQHTAYRFLAGGVGNLIAGWTAGGMETPVDELADEIEKMSQAFLAAYVELAQQKSVNL